MTDLTTLMNLDIDQLRELKRQKELALEAKAFYCPRTAQLIRDLADLIEAME